jgi:hypothetical protein
MNEFEVGGHKYRSGTMDARKQFHVMRRLATVLDALRDMPKKHKIEALVDTPEADAGDQDSLLSAVAPLAKAIGSMSDEDVDYVFEACLGIVQRQDGNAWQKVWNTQSKVVQYSDIDMAAMLQITWHVLQGSFAAFFRALPQELTV